MKNEQNKNKLHHCTVDKQHEILNYKKKAKCESDLQLLENTEVTKNHWIKMQCLLIKQQFKIHKYSNLQSKIHTLWSIVATD